MDIRSVFSDVVSGVSLLGRKNYAEEVTETIITGGCGGKKWSAGFASETVLPDDYTTKKYYIAGYHENNPAQGLLDPQTVGALYLSDGSAGGGHIFISVDAVGLLNKDVEHIRSSLKGFCANAGIASVTVFCTHDHAGIDTMGIWGNLPHTGKSARFMSLLFRACYNASIRAYRSRAEGKLYFGSVEVPDMQEDVRTPEVFSKTLTRFRFTPDEEGNDIYFINFAAHAETLQAVNSLISADYPCYFRNKIKTVSGADTVFSNGAIGGMITMRIEDEERLRKEKRLPESTAAIGEKLADYALSITDETELTPSVLHARKEYYSPVENTVLTLACRIGLLNADRYDLPYSNEKALKTELNYYEIGGVKLLGVPGELFPELAYGGYLTADESATGEGDFINPLPLTSIAGEDLIIIGLCNDEIGYIIPPNDFLLDESTPYMDKATDRLGRRHYEETNSLGPKTAGILADNFTMLITEVNKYKSEAKS